MPISCRFLGFWKTADGHIAGSNVRYKFTRVAQFLIILVNLLRRWAKCCVTFISWLRFENAIQTVYTNTLSKLGRIIWNLNSVQILILASSSQVKQKGQISLNSHEATSARYYTDRGNSKYSMQIPERVTFEFGHPTCVGHYVERTMHGRAINGICPRQLASDIIEEIPLHEHLVKYPSKRCIGKLSLDAGSQSVFHYPT